MGAMGNQIGVITDLEAAVLASGFDEDIYVLVPELQKEIDGLKHNTCADRSVLKEIRERAPKPVWLGLKNSTSLDELPLQIEVLPTDRIGRYYNSMRPEIQLMMGEPMQVSQFSGLIVGNSPTQEMFNECELIRRIFNSGHDLIRQRTIAEEDRVRHSTATLDAALAARDEDAIAAARLEHVEAHQPQGLVPGDAQHRAQQQVAAGHRLAGHPCVPPGIRGCALRADRRDSVGCRDAQGARGGSG